MKIFALAIIIVFTLAFGGCGSNNKNSRYQMVQVNQFNYQSNMLLDTQTGDTWLFGTNGWKKNNIER